jgi:hypothetical protein
MNFIARGRLANQPERRTGAGEWAVEFMKYPSWKEHGTHAPDVVTRELLPLQPPHGS